MITDQIKRSMQLRKQAEALIELAGEQPPRFWELLLGLVKEKLPPNDELQPMTTEEALAFEKESMPWGTHKNIPIGMIPTSYLIWFVDGDNFGLQIKRYVQSIRFGRRQETET